MNVDTGELGLFDSDDEVPEGFVPVTQADYERLNKIESRKKRKAEFLRLFQELDEKNKVVLNRLVKR